jgi:hypothetical protein
VTLSACILGEPARTLSFDGGLATPSAPSTTHSCGALQVRGGRSRSVSSKRVRAHPRRYGRSPMFSITAKGATRGDVRGALAKVLEARDESLGLGALGFGVTHVRRKRLHGVLVHEVGAEGGGRVIGYTRVGGGLRVDHTLYRAGQAAGRNSGADQCGHIVPNYPAASPGVRCTDIRATRGDSGGPVYESTGELRTRAVGITAEVVTIHRSMCYTPLGPILQAFGATLAPGTEVPNGVVF